MRATTVVAFVVSLVAVPSCGASGSSRRHSTATITRGPVTTPPTSHAPALATTVTTTTTTTTTTAPDAWATAPALDTLEGRVSYYADALAGHRTANGESYDPHALTCASRDLPFGTLIRIVRPDTGASVVVRVNDRGPWGRTRPRILDLSRAAAEAIDMIRAGVVEVRAEIVRRGE